MKSKKLFTFFSLICLMLSSYIQITSKELSQNSSHVTKLDGTFMQPYYLINYDLKQWDNEMKTLKEIGVKYIVMVEVGNHNNDRSWTIFYPSELDFLSNYYYFAYDAVEILLYFCDKYSIKAILGMGVDYSWNNDCTSESARQANRIYMNDLTRISEELYLKYKPKYPDTFYGFHFGIDLFNRFHMDTDSGIDSYADALDEMFTMIIDNLNKLDPSMPLVFSPFLNIYGYGYASINIDRFTEYWTEVLTRIPFRNGDMILAYDSCGRNGNDLEHLGTYMEAYRNAVDRANEKRGTKLLLCSIAEMYNYPNSEKMGMNFGVSYNGIKSLKEFTKGLEISNKYVDYLFSYSYPQQYSPYITWPEFHSSFSHYLKSGEIETEPPSPPTKVDVEFYEKDGKKYPKYILSGMKDNVGVSQTNIYKNGKLYEYIVTAVKMGGNKEQNFWVDYKYTEDKSVFEIEIIDISGNVSKKCSFEMDYNELKSKGKLSLETKEGIKWEKTVLDLLTYEVNDSGVRIKGCDKDVVEIEIPDKIEGKPVNVIDWYAFERCYKLKSVKIPDTVTHFSRFAFVHCINLENVNMPKSLYSIEQNAFLDCPKLKGIEFPESLNFIEDRAFSGCRSISQLTIPKSVQLVGEYAFFDCDSLNEVKINTEAKLGLKSIGFGYNNGYYAKKDFTIYSDKQNAVQYAKDNGFTIKN